MRKVLLLLLALTLFGCDRSPTSPRHSGQVILDVAVETTSGSPTVRAVAANDRASAIWHYVGPTYWAPGMNLHFIDASGATLHVRDIRQPLPAWAGYFATLQPGERTEGKRALSGTLYTDQGDPVPMQSGTYTAVVTYRWSPADEPSRPWYVREQRVQFDWPVPSP